MSDLILEHLNKWEKFRIEFLDEKDRLYQLDSEIQQIASDYLIVSAPKLGGEKYDLPVDSEVSIVFYRSDGLLYGQTIILGKQSGFGEKIKISIPYNNELIDRRRSKRVKVALKLEVSYYLNKNSMQKKVLNELTYDVSSTGLSYLSDNPLGKYYDIKAYIFLDKNFEDPVIADCQYVTSRRKTIRGKELYQVVLEYIKISRDDIMRLQQRCYRG